MDPVGQTVSLIREALTPLFGLYSVLVWKTGLTHYIIMVQLNAIKACNQIIHIYINRVNITQSNQADIH